MRYTPTPLEEAILNAHNFGDSLASVFIINNLVEKNISLRLEKIQTPICGHLEERKSIVTEIRNNDQKLAAVAQLQETNLGICT